MIYALYAVHIVISLFLILVVLLQSGRSADLSALGGGATQTTFGARGATSLLHRLTVICFVLFIFTTLGIGVFQSGGAPSVMDDVQEAPAGETAPSDTAPSDTAPSDTAPSDTAPSDPATGAEAVESEPPSIEEASEGSSAEGSAGGEDEPGSEGEDGDG